MRRFSPLPFLALTSALALTSVAVPVFAQPRTREAAVSAEDQKKAQEHFHKARELYSSGRYGDALTELEIARSLDPKARDLVMNLGIVNEKLGKFDEAIGSFRTFLDMDDVTPAERNRAEGFIKRIEGAKKEHAAKHPPAKPPSSSTPPPAGSSTPSTPPPASTMEAPNGRVDGLTIGAGVLAGVGAAVGATFGALALANRPSNFITGRDGTYADLESKTETAHTMAIVSDVGFGVGVVAAIATLYLYFGRTKEPSRSSFAAGSVRF